MLPRERRAEMTLQRRIGVSLRTERPALFVISLAQSLVWCLRNSFNKSFVIHRHAGENRHPEGVEILDSGSRWLSPACPE